MPPSPPSLPQAGTGQGPSHLPCPSLTGSRGSALRGCGGAGRSAGSGAVGGQPGFPHLRRPVLCIIKATGDNRNNSTGAPEGPALHMSPHLLAPPLQGLEVILVNRRGWRCCLFVLDPQRPNHCSCLINVCAIIGLKQELGSKCYQC